MPYAMERSELAKYADYDEASRRMRVRLGELEIVLQMLKPALPSWQDSVPLLLIGVENREHANGEIYLHLALFSRSGGKKSLRGESTPGRQRSEESRFFKLEGERSAPRGPSAVLFVPPKTRRNLEELG